MGSLETVKSGKEPVGRRRSIGTGREIEFTFSSPNAKNVSIAGKFNDWNMTSMPMKKGADGTWRIKLKLSPGKYEYKFVVDGTWAQDISCSEKILNTFGTYNCIIGVE